MQPSAPQDASSFSASPDELIETVRSAATARQRRRIAGAGTKAFLFPSQADDRPVLDARAWSGIVSHEPTELVVTVKAGTPLHELDAALSAHQQYLPFDPPRYAEGGTVGGGVAAGLAGPARASVGGARDYVLGAQFIDGRGQWMTFGGQVMKNVAGYDVSRALVGSRGQLGLITDISLKVLPLPPAETTLVFELDQARALQQLHVWGGQPLPINASRWEGGEVPRLHVRLRGAVAAVEAATQRMCGDAAGQVVANEAAQRDWAQCRDHQLAFFRTAGPEMSLWRLSVPQTAAAMDLPYAQLIEWQGAQRWLWAPAASSEAIRSATHAVRGHAQLFRAGVGGDQGVPREDAVPPAVAAITRRLREAFDPHGIFAPMQD
ncbi:glycolate oxidase subunit GlcE [Hydrogenophaga sp. 5NK40-0174]|uniref:glycolate oxidase subunit GlcE n=1 Tax=Hydrogenophaga sp. 5NK40-0174 TaxID=3127649 RepID=UPI00333EA594